MLSLSNCNYNADKTETSYKELRLSNLIIYLGQFQHIQTFGTKLLNILCCIMQQHLNIILRKIYYVVVIGGSKSGIIIIIRKISTEKQIMCQIIEKISYFGSWISYGIIIIINVLLMTILCDQCMWFIVSRMRALNQTVCKTTWASFCFLPTIQNTMPTCTPSLL